MFIHLFLLWCLYFRGGHPKFHRMLKKHCKSYGFATCRFRSVDASEFEETVGGEVLWIQIPQGGISRWFFWILVGDCWLCTMVDHHQIIIWENMYQLFPSIFRNSKYTQGMCLFKVPETCQYQIKCLEVMEPPKNHNSSDISGKVFRDSSFQVSWPWILLLRVSKGAHGIFPTKKMYLPWN